MANKTATTKFDTVPLPDLSLTSAQAPVATTTESKADDRPVTPSSAAPAAEPPQVKHAHHQKATTDTVSKSAARHAAKHAAALSKTAKALERLAPLTPTSFQPQVELTVKFSTGKKAALGKELSLIATLTEPMISWAPAPDPSKFYTVVLVDPDMPSRASPKMAERRLWVVSNIPGAPAPSSASATKSGTSPDASGKDAASPGSSTASVAPNLDKGDVLQEYEAPEPEAGTGLHHYAVLVFEQTRGRMPELHCFEGARDRWNAMRWADKNKMTLLGANFWQAQEKA